MPIYRPALPVVDARETRRYAGLAKAEFDEATIDAACEEAALLAEPCVQWEAFDYDCESGCVASSPPFIIKGAVVRKHLAGAERVIFFTATIGEEVENAVARHFEEGRYAHSVLLDAAATTAVEQVCDALETMLRPNLAKEGFSMRWRFSPGYGDWDIHAQPELLRLTRAESIGVSLTESFMLCPRKTVTAVIGLVRGGGEERSAPRGCASCNKIDCPSRKEKALFAQSIDSLRLSPK
ncbi:MAG: methionine synthase [Schwartzia sp.]|nr:methionine synthase [Schwartzia sp. (in: firmicutes)]